MGSKIIFFFAWLGIMFFTILGLTFALYPSYFSNLNINSLIFRGLILNISVTYIMIILLKVKYYFKKEKDYIINNEYGSIHISTDAVKNLIDDILKEDRDIKKVSIICGTEDSSNYFVRLKLKLSSDESYSLKTSELQNRIKSELEGRLNLILNNIEIEVINIKDKRNSKGI